MEDKFKIIYLSCGSEDVSVKEDIDYDYDEYPYINGYYLECNSCKEHNLFYGRLSMKKIFCSDTTCVHNENINIGFTSMLVCARCDDVIVNAWHDRCDGYENIEKYLDRINTY